MSAAKTKPSSTKRAGKSQSAERASETDQHPQSTRETVESVVVAFVLAFLFRAFVAEAFVIPTGSMAPTLMGAHKDITCSHCGEQYQASASMEYDSNSGALQPRKTLASTCANCRGINVYDFRNEPNHETFSGDRILVSKFDYVLSKPERWDVFVFKFPLEARMNYIKRLIGLPGETLRIEGGDVYVQTQESAAWEIARKPPHKIQAMKQVVHDTTHQPAELVASGWPSSWQPWTAGGDESAWQVEHTPESWSARVASDSQTDWIRYYHKFLELEQWSEVASGQAVPSIDRHSSRLITDYLAYNTSFEVQDASGMFDLRRGRFDSVLPGFLRRGPYWAPQDRMDEDQNVLEFARQRGVYVDEGFQNDGLHWVGDLSAQFDVTIESGAGKLLLDLVEFGIHFRCEIDVASGEATLMAIDGDERLPIFDGEAAVVGQTQIDGPGTYRIEFANFDDQLVLWVGGSPVDFDGKNRFGLSDVRSGPARRPYWTESDPLDAAPVGLGASDLTLNVDAARVYRDIYYIAVQPYTQRGYSDYMLSNSGALRDSIPDADVRSQLRDTRSMVEAIYKHPDWWAKTDLFALRGSKEYQLEDGQYFPMGDNSAASSDARAWFGHNYVEEKFLLGKALLVFWPHTWNAPVPFTPNIPRMGLIR